MPAKANLKPDVVHKLNDIHQKNGTLDNIQRSGIGEQLVSHPDPRHIALGEFDIGSYWIPVYFDGTDLRIVNQEGGGYIYWPRSPVVVDDTLFFLGQRYGWDDDTGDYTEQNVYSIDLATGETDTLASLGRDVFDTFIGTSGDAILIGTEDAVLVMDSKTGAIVKDFDGISARMAWSANAQTIGDATYFPGKTADGSEALLKFDGETQELTAVLEASVFDVSIAGEQLFVGSRTSDGDVNLHQISDNGSIALIDIDGGQARYDASFLTIAGTTYFTATTTSGSAVYRIDADSVARKVASGDAIIGEHDGGVVIASGDGNISLLSKNGKVRQYQEAEGDIEGAASVVIDGHVAYIRSSPTDPSVSNVYWLNLDTGKSTLAHSTADSFFFVMSTGDELLTVTQEGDYFCQYCSSDFYLISPDDQGLAEFTPVDKVGAQSFGTPLFTWPFEVDNLLA